MSDQINQMKPPSKADRTYSRFAHSTASGSSHSHPHPLLAPSPNIEIGTGQMTAAVSQQCVLPRQPYADRPTAGWPITMVRPVDAIKVVRVHHPVRVRCVLDIQIEEQPVISAGIGTVRFTDGAPVADLRRIIRQPQLVVCKLAASAYHRAVCTSLHATMLGSSDLTIAEDEGPPFSCSHWVKDLIWSGVRTQPCSLEWSLPSLVLSVAYSK